MGRLLDAAADKLIATGETLRWLAILTRATP